MGNLADQINYGASNLTGAYLQGSVSGYQAPQGITGPGGKTGCPASRWD